MDQHFALQAEASIALNSSSLPSFLPHGLLLVVLLAIATSSCGRISGGDGADAAAPGNGLAPSGACTFDGKKILNRESTAAFSTAQSPCNSEVRTC